MKIYSGESRGGLPSLFWARKEEMTEGREAGTPPPLAQGLVLLCEMKIYTYFPEVLLKNLLRTFYSPTIITVKTRFLSEVAFFVGRVKAILNTLVNLAKKKKKMAAFSLRLYLAIEVNRHFLENKFGDPSLG